MSKHKRGKVLRSDEREIVYNAIKYFDKEKNAKKYQPYEQSEQRAAIATGLPVSAILKIKQEGPLKQESSTKPCTTKKRSRRVVLNHDELCAFREIIELIYKDMEIPTVRKILMSARKELKFEGSRAKVRGILRNKLGFKFNKRHSNKNIVLERNSIKAWRARYLRFIRENDDLGANKKPVVYVGELMINIPLQSTERPTKRQTQKWMIFHAGSENGFIKDAELFYNYSQNKEKPKARDYLKYVQETVIPKLPKECIVVMNNSARHNMQVDAIPTMFSTKDEIKKWMVDHYVPFEEDWYKAEMIMRIKNTHPVKKFAVDELLAKHGHTALRIPPFNTDLNPIEYIWMKIKSRVAKNVNDDLSCDLIYKAMEDISAKDWKEVIDRVKQIEERYWSRDFEKEDAYDDLICKVGLLSDSDSDTDTEYEYNWYSSSSEESDDRESEDDWTDTE